MLVWHFSYLMNKLKLYEVNIFIKCLTNKHKKSSHAVCESCSVIHYFKSCIVFLGAGISLLPYIRCDPYRKAGVLSLLLSVSVICGCAFCADVEFPIVSPYFIVTVNVPQGICHAFSSYIYSCHYI